MTMMIKYVSHMMVHSSKCCHATLYYRSQMIGSLHVHNSTDEPENFIPDVDQQIYDVDYGTMPNLDDDKPTMKGFVKNYLRYREKTRAAEVMQGLNRTTLPVLYKLVEEYAISDVSGVVYPSPILEMLIHTFIQSAGFPLYQV